MHMAIGSCLACGIMGNVSERVNIAVVGIYLSVEHLLGMLTTHSVTLKVLIIP